MDYETSTQLGAGFFLVFGVWSLVGLAVYVWYLWSLSRLFPYLGLPSGWGWIPLWNQWQLIQRGGLPGWLALFMIVPGLSIVTLVISIIAIHRINTEFGKGAGFTVLGAFIAPLWATLFAGQLRDREFGNPGYLTGEYSQVGGGFDGSAHGYAPAPAYGAAGFAPQPVDQHDPAWQGLPPVPQQQAAPHDPWAAPQPVPQPVPQAAPQPQPGGHHAPVAAPSPAQAEAPADPWQQPPAPGGQAPGAQAPAPNNWGFSNTTEGDYERLAAEGVAPRPPAPLGGVAPPRPFSWPAVEDTKVEHESGPLVLPEPSEAALSQGAQQESAPVPAPEPPQAAHPGAQAVADPEPSIFDRRTPAAPPAAPQTAAPQPAAPQPAAPEPAVAPPTAAPPVAAPPVAAPPAAPPVTPPVAPSGLDEDHTVVVSRRARWGLELPGGETLELEGDDIVIGRKPESREGSSVLQISDPTRTTSKSHARLRRDGDEWTIEDLQSTNGVSLVSTDGAVTQLESGRSASATEQMIIGTLEVRLIRL